MGDDHRGDERGKLLHRFATVLVDIHHQVGRRKFADGVDAHVLVPPTLETETQLLTRMDAKAGAADQQFRKPQVAEQFGKGRHQAHDARPLAGRLVNPADGIDKREFGR